MKGFIATLATIALLMGNEQSQVTAVKLNQRAEFVDDIVKALAQSDKEEENSSATKKEEAKPKTKPVEKKEDKKKDDKKAADDEIPMDNAAIKAYSSVIADAAEDSEPAVPVQYTEIKDEAKADSRMSHAPVF